MAYVNNLQTMSNLQTVSQALNPGTNTANLYINFAGQGTGTLTGDQVDSKLNKVDRLLAFRESMTRNINPAAENNLFSGGAITATNVHVKMLRTKSALFAEKSFYSANNIGPITIYRGDIINAKLTVTEEIEFTNCIVTSIETNNDDNDPNVLDTIDVAFRYTQKKHTLYLFGQDGKPMGQDVSLINFPAGSLQDSGGGGGGGADADAGGGDAI